MRLAVVTLILALSVMALKSSSRLSFKDAAVLRWTPVKTDTSGKPLKNLAGYKIYYGMSERAMHTVIMLKNPNQTNYVVRNLHPGTWYFAVCAYTTSGVEGALSNLGSKTIK